MVRLVQTDDWKKELETNLWENTYMNSVDTRAHLAEEYAQMKSALTDLGLATR